MSVSESIPDDLSSLWNTRTNMNAVACISNPNTPVERCEAAAGASSAGSPTLT